MMSFSERLLAAAILSLALGGTASAQPFTATGFGETASGAITNAAVNAVRDAAGSRITVRQEVTTEVVNGVPDERFIEELLEVSRGTVSHLQVLSVTQVGDIFEAEVMVEIDPGRLEIDATETERLTLPPGAFASGVAEATLRAGGQTQLQDALNEFVSLDSKVVTVRLVAVETDEQILQMLRHEGRLSEGIVPLRVVIEIANRDGIVGQMEEALRAAAAEVPLQGDFIDYGNGEVMGDYRCDSPQITSDTITFILLKEDPDPQVDVAYFWCGWMNYNYRTSLMGSAETLFALGAPVVADEAMRGTTVQITLEQSDGSEKSFDFPILANDYWPVMAPNGAVITSTAEGQTFLNEVFGNQFTLSPSALLAAENNSEPRAWVAFEKIWLSFTLPVPPDVAAATTAVGVTLSRP